MTSISLCLSFVGSIFRIEIQLLHYAIALSFFWETRLAVPRNLFKKEAKRVQWTSKPAREAMSLGSSSNQTWVPLQVFAFLAKASATTLQTRETWEKLANWRSKASTRISSMTCSNGKTSEHPSYTTWMTVDESPSKMTWESPISLANCTTLRHASTSSWAIVWTRGTNVVNAPIASPHQSLITTPKPAKFFDLNTAASKLALKKLASGGRHCWSCWIRGGSGFALVGS